MGAIDLYRQWIAVIAGTRALGVSFLHSELSAFRDILKHQNKPHGGEYTQSLATTRSDPLR
jgi:hypothetical protein